MQFQDKVSIIVAVHNAENFIRASIQSVLLQSYSNWELLIINDGSTDKTKEIIAEFSDNRIRCFSQKNNGVSAARNVGLRNMTGEYFCFLDSDDTFTPNSLQSRIDVFRRDSRLHFVDGRIDFFDESLSIKKGTWIPSFIGNPLPNLLSISGLCFFGATWMVRREKNKSYKFNVNLAHGEDLLFFIDLAAVGGIYSYTNDTILHYRMGHQSAMKNLKGLEDGYHKIYHILMSDPRFSYTNVAGFSSKARNIIFKSYLGHFQPLNAFLSLLRKW